MPSAVPQLEERDFAAIEGCLQVIESLIISRSHLPVTNKRLAELQRALMHERRAVGERLGQTAAPRPNGSHDRPPSDAALTCADFRGRLRVRTREANAVDQRGTAPSPDPFKPAQFMGNSDLPMGGFYLTQT
jgi:hypothetical protein